MQRGGGEVVAGLPWPSGDQIGLAICEALGISTTNISGLTLECRPGEVASVTVMRFLLDEDVPEIRTTMERYEAVPKDDAGSAEVE